MSSISVVRGDTVSPICSGVAITGCCTTDGHAFVRVVDPKRGLAGSEEQVAPGTEYAGNLGEHRGLHRSVEIDQNVPQEDDVHEWHLPQWSRQVQLGEADHVAHSRLQLPVAPVAFEVLDQHCSGQPAIDLELGVATGLGASDDVTGKVGGQDHHVWDIAKVFAYDQRHAVRLLTGRRSR